MAEENTGVKISLLPSATNLADANVLAGVQGNTTRKFSLSALKAFFLAAVTPAGIGAVPTSRTVNGYALSSDISLDASDVSAEAEIQVGSISLSSSWTGNASPYTQTVTVTGATVTANSKIDIQLTAVQIASLIAAGVTGLVIENNAGTLTAYAVGAQTGAMTIQVTVTEVS